VIADLTGNGYPDIYVANDYDQQNRLWINDGQANFTAGDIEGDLGYSRSVVIADLNEDGKPDIYVANTGDEQNRLWINKG